LRTRNRLRQIRLERGLSQRELALQAGVPLSTVARIDGMPTAKIELEVARRIAMALKVDPFELVRPIP